MKGRKTGNKKILLRSLLTGLLLLLLASSYGCSKNNAGNDVENTSEVKKTYVYYINRDRTRIQGEEITFTSDTCEGQIEEMTEALKKDPRHNELRTSLNNNFNLIGCTLQDENLTLNVDSAYKNLAAGEEILVRAALVRSYTQIQGVSYVQFSVDGEALTDVNGVVVGLLSADSFIENDGKEINAYEKVTVTLYFSNMDGTRLISGQRQVVYNTNVSMEKMVVEQLIKGPQLAGYYPTINPETKILSVVNKDGTCYVNLSEEFLRQTYTVSTDVVLYSIANSLTELSTVNRVQIQIGGNSNVLFRDTVSLDAPIERNLDIVMKEEE